MKRYYITIIYPGMQQINLSMYGKLTRGDGYYFFIDEVGDEFYLPTNFTVITTKKDWI